MSTNSRATLDHLCQHVIDLLDQGKCLPPLETMRAIQDGQILHYLKEHFPELDLSLLMGDYEEHGRKLAKALSEVGCAYPSCEKRKNGLLVLLECIRIAYTSRNCDHDV